jgi:FlaA1/EpsC-like NDP-sugar epimerase
LVIVVLSYYAMLIFRYEGYLPEGLEFGSYRLSFFLGAAVIVHLAFNSFLHVYSIVNRYVGLQQALWIVKATVASVAVLLLLDLFWPRSGSMRLVPLSVVLVGGALAGAIMIAFRFYSRAFQTLSLSPVHHGRRVLIVGAGSAGATIAEQIAESPALGLTVVGLVDDNPRLHKMRIHQYPVLGTIADAPRVAEENAVEEFLIAIPSADPKQMERIYSILRQADRPIKVLPAMTAIFEGRVSMADVREIQYEDFLGRLPVETDLGAVAGYLRDRRVLVTGAAGSIGSELCRQISSFEPESLIMVDRNESGLYDLHEWFRARGFSRYTLVATHIQQRGKMARILREHRPHVVFHAAAFKHVPLMEHFPDEAVLNNVRGTLVVAQEAGAAGVERFINISTDKAADPISAMGASKAVAELVVRDVGEEFPATRYCSVRFGNVLGSRGSVIPVFQKQIEAGGPVTVTHRDMTRYFMSISEAVQLVLQAASMADEPEVHGGVFVLNMGEPVKIIDLAAKMIEFATDGGAPPIDIVFTGLRPGERMHELLVGSLEQATPTPHPMIMLVSPVWGSDDGGSGGGPGGGGPGGDGPGGGHTQKDFRQKLRALIALARRHADREEIAQAFGAILPTYQPFSLEESAAFPVGGNGHAEAAHAPAGADATRGADADPSADWAAGTGAAAGTDATPAAGSAGERSPRVGFEDIEGFE